MDGDTLRLPLDPRSVRRARSHVRERLDAWGLSDLVDDAGGIQSPQQLGLDGLPHLGVRTPGLGRFARFVRFVTHG